MVRQSLSPSVSLKVPVALHPLLLPGDELLWLQCPLSFSIRETSEISALLSYAYPCTQWHRCLFAQSPVIEPETSNHS